MELFWTQITDAQPARPARTKAHGSAWGVSLLAYAVRAVWGIDLPETAELPGGKPYFPACPQLHFSVSHTRTAALVAVSAAPVGAEILVVTQTSADGTSARSLCTQDDLFARAYVPSMLSGLLRVVDVSLDWGENGT